VLGLKAAGGAGLWDREIEEVRGEPAPLDVAARVSTFARAGGALGAGAGALGAEGWNTLLMFRNIDPKKLIVVPLRQGLTRFDQG
tara:strand:+ start:1008 stop:1262 length:255 start_codon:yes stop_codon:yes gene_type:complete